MRGRWMLPVVEILVRWNIRPLICRQALGCFTSARFTARIISGSSSPSSMLSLSAGIRDCTIRLSIPTLIMPFFGYRNANARPNWSVRHRRRNFIKSSYVQNNGLIRITSEIQSLSGKPLNGERFLLTSVGNKAAGKAFTDKKNRHCVCNADSFYYKPYY